MTNKQHRSGDGIPVAAAVVTMAIVAKALGFIPFNWGAVIVISLVLGWMIEGAMTSEDK